MDILSNLNGSIRSTIMPEDYITRNEFTAALEKLAERFERSVEKFGEKIEVGFTRMSRQETDINILKESMASFSTWVREINVDRRECKAKCEGEITGIKLDRVQSRAIVEEMSRALEERKRVDDEFKAEINSIVDRQAGQKEQALNRKRDMKVAFITFGATIGAAFLGLLAVAISNK